MSMTARVTGARMARGAPLLSVLYYCIFRAVSQISVQGIFPGHSTSLPARERCPRVAASPACLLSLLSYGATNNANVRRHSFYGYGVSCGARHERKKRTYLLCGGGGATGGSQQQLADVYSTIHLSTRSPRTAEEEESRYCVRVRAACSPQDPPPYAVRACYLQRASVLLQKRSA